MTRALFQKVNRHGQLTIPVEIREQCGIKEGDFCGFKLREDGAILVSFLDVDLTPRKFLATRTETKNAEP